MSESEEQPGSGMDTGSSGGVPGDHEPAERQVEQGDDGVFEDEPDVVADARDDVPVSPERLPQPDSRPDPDTPEFREP